MLRRLVPKAADGLCKMAAAETLFGSSSTASEHVDGCSAVLPPAHHGRDSAHHGGAFGISYFALHSGFGNGTHVTGLADMVLLAVLTAFVLFLLRCCASCPPTWWRQLVW